VIILAGLGLCVPALARERPHPATSMKRPLPPSIAARLLSPNRRHAAEVTADGAVRVDGRRVSAAGDQLLGSVVWRRDSRALAFLARGASGLRLVVVPDLAETDPPLIWHLPPISDGARAVFWISSQRVGVGPRPLTPRIVVSWTTSYAARVPAPSRDNV
jgi:hypothetical protein